MVAARGVPMTLAISLVAVSYTHLINSYFPLMRQPRFQLHDIIRIASSFIDDLTVDHRHISL